LDRFGAAARIREVGQSSATVELAAEALGVEPARIAKTLSFADGEGALLVVAAGDARIDNRKYKDRFGGKARMLAPQSAERLVGHAVGGVCPFGVNDGVPIYLDASLRRFETVFPACGSGNSMIEVTLAELSDYAAPAGWVDVTKLPEPPVPADPDSADAERTGPT
jgi:prolyl-tRNA editing enzyme YbaK/EbsC (Cys-tRNA(Pro) deacylase)